MTDHTEDGHTGDDGAAEAQAAGRALVRTHLLNPLATLQRSRGQTQADYDRLSDQLAYMSELSLRGLCEFVLRLAGGGTRPVPVPRCPPPDLIRAWAYALQPPPPRSSAFMSSVMRSAMGREACDAGWHVELMRHLRKWGPPLSRYSRDTLMAEADDNRRMLARIRERLSAGSPMRDDRDWLAAWHDDTRLAEALIAEGDARRAAKAAMAGPEGQAA